MLYVPLAARLGIQIRSQFQTIVCTADVLYSLHGQDTDVKSSAGVSAEFVVEIVFVVTKENTAVKSIGVLNHLFQC
uniref:Uncharacterized protein n=1 Tax=Arundo donax TaxID=35708 RepID=A0A0A9HF70_ARUDO